MYHCKINQEISFKQYKTVIGKLSEQLGIIYILTVPLKVWTGAGSLETLPKMTPWCMPSLGVTTPQVALSRGYSLALNPHREKF